MGPALALDEETGGAARNDGPPTRDGDAVEGFTGLQELQKEVEEDRFSLNDSEDGEFAHFQAEEETAVSLMLSHKSYTKLETIAAREISLLLALDNVLYFVSALYCIALVIAFNVDSSFAGETAVPSYEETIVALNFKNNEGLNNFEDAIKIICFSWAVILAVIYTVRLMRESPKNRTAEQMWVILLTWATSVYLIPYDTIVSIQIRTGSAQPSPLDDLIKGIVYSIQVAGFTTATTFYIWTSAHSYRLLKGRLPYSFYVPKLCVLLSYIMLQLIARNVLDMAVSPVPFLTFFSLVHTADVFGTGYSGDGVIFVMMLTMWELLTFMWVVRDLLVTKKILQGTTYMRFRTKQIGFRFFLYNTLVFYTLYWSLLLLQTVALPMGYTITPWFANNAMNFVAPYVVSFMSVVLMTYVTTEAYVKLPADAIGWKGWFVSQPLPKERVGDEFKPMTYKKRETASFSGVFEDLGTNCFTMQTHVLMFNFAWYVYYHGTKKAENFKLKKDVFEFEIHKMISNKETDTHVLVVDGTDRIVVAFRGTTSAKNLRTDIAIKFIRTDALLPTAKDEEHIGFAEDTAWVYESALFGKARLHQGFAEAYRSIAEPLLVTLKQLYLAKRRPVFLTGHSLGGCLATLCSFDLALSLGLGKREMFVSTFGSPRCGNVFFRDIYNQLCPIHWRIVLAPDIVTKLPKFTYRHCGKKVLITTGGELFLDPNALELKIWHGDTSSVLYHRKASYLLAMRGWCELNHGDEYVPEFWPWPVSADDSKRFESVFLKGSQKNQSANPASSSTTGTHYKLLSRDNLLNKLAGPEAGHAESDPIALWARITRRVLLAQIQGDDDKQA